MPCRFRSLDYTYHAIISDEVVSSVPLDYTNSSAGVAKIALGRYNATASPRKGLVFFNPGGPGSAGVSMATQTGKDFELLVSAGHSFSLACPSAMPRRADW